jgi:hypothetical protein
VQMYLFTTAKVGRLHSVRRAVVRFGLSERPLPQKCVVVRRRQRKLLLPCSSALGRYQ